MPFAFRDGNPKPIEGYDARMAAARTMYHELSPETAEFIDFMYDNELLDVLSRKGKAGGGYCILFCRLPPFYRAINFLMALFMLLSMLSHAAEQF